jgi:carbon storage regulator
VLILTRYRGQRVMIGDDIVITFIKHDAHNGGVRLGIEAPSGVKILREELVDGFVPRDLSTKSVDNKVGKPEVKVKPVKRWGILCAPSGLPRE